MQNLFGLIAAGMLGLAAGAALTLVLSMLRGQGIARKSKRDAAQVITDAEREAASILKDGKAAVKELEINLRARLEQEGRDLRKEMAEVERRLATKEQGLDKRAAAQDKKAADLNTQERALVAREK